MKLMTAKEMAKVTEKANSITDQTARILDDCYAQAIEGKDYYIPAYFLSEEVIQSLESLGYKVVFYDHAIEYAVRWGD